MKRKHSTKRALIASVVSLCLCFSMLIGTTYAWFTDSVTSGNNIIKSGKLDVEMAWAEGAEAVPTSNDGWTDASAGPIFDYENWEPGYTEARHIKISNVGTLALKYSIRIIPDGEVSELADVIDVYYADPAKQADRTLADLTKLGTLTDVLSKMGSTANGTLEAGTNDTITLVLKMQESAGNEYQNMSIGSTFSVQLVATQLMSEEDSLGDDYDKDAWTEGMNVSTAEDLQAAVANGYDVVLQNDITLTEPIVVPAVEAATYARTIPTTVIDLNGKTITTAYNESTNKHAYAIDNYGNLKIVGGTIEARGIYNREGANLTVNGTKIFNLDTNGGSCIWSYGGSVVLNNATLIGYTGCVYSLGSLEINGGTYTCYSAVLDDGTQISPTYNIRSEGDLVINDGNFTSRHGLVAVSGGTATINGGTYTMTSIGVITSHVIYIGGKNVNVVVNNGIFNCDLTTAQNNGSSQICVNATDSTVTVSGGIFNHKSFESYVAEGYKAVNHGGLYYIVSGDATNEGTLYISTVDELKDFASAVNNGNHYAGKTVALLADIDLGGAAWTPIGISSGKGFSGTFDGQGHTISNFKLATSSGTYGAGFFGNLLGGAAIKNVNFDSVSYNTRSNIVGVAAGYLYGSGTFENINVTNIDVRSFGKVGGILGMAADPGAHTITMTNCSVEGAIGGGYNVGGLIGLVLQGQTVNLTNCETDVVFYMDDGGYNMPYVQNDAGWMWKYGQSYYAGVAEQYCYYDAAAKEFCMGEPAEMYFVASNATQLQAVAQNGGTVILTNDIIVDVADTGFVVAKGISAKLDLNGYDIIATSTSADANVQLFSVSGDLEIVGEGTISLINDNFAWSTSVRYTAINIRETGVVTLGEGVNVVCETGKATEGGYGMCYAVDIYTTGTLNVNGASLHSNYIAVRCFYGNSVVNVNGGSITSSKNNWGIWLQSADGAKITIADGIAYKTDSYGIYIFD